MKRNKTISFGDRIFARVTLNGRTVLDFVSEQVANMADLISQLRKSMKNIHGLVTLHIRNYNQGWGEERPLMLYAQKYNTSWSPVSSVHEVATTQPQRRMLCPWETH